MPLQSVWMIRLSLGYLIGAVLTGVVILVHKAIFLHDSVWAMLPVHYEMAIWGWMVQFVMGTAYWIFPRFLKSKGRGPASPAWSVVVMINLGVILLAGSVLKHELATAGRVSILTGTLIFVALMWSRVVSYRKKKP